ncbi:hypothetical protein VNI00_016124 [Paramarasmius palmivorus]|uniref:RING-type domain-containing protein n=1 Tax=Paramarasmius palmivorus TaxID=297713 RepID=A0AAW0BEG8_9AGAR
MQRHQHHDIDDTVCPPSAPFLHPRNSPRRRPRSSTSALSPSQRFRGPSTSRPAIRINDRLPVVEISSSDSDRQSDDELPTVTVKDLRHEVKRLKEGIALTQEQCNKAEKKSEEAEAEARSAKKRANKILAAKELEVAEWQSKYNLLRAQSMDAFIFDRSVRCGICEGLMWVPCALAACGHVFCFTCLHSWFQAILDNFRLQYPDYNPREHSAAPLTAEERLQFIGIQYAHEAIPILRTKVPIHPHYTCPDCRGHVSQRPVVIYALKNIITELGSIRRLEPLGSNGEQDWENFWPSRTQLRQ